MLYDLMNLFDEVEECRMLPINLKEKDGCYELEVALPGYSKEEISIAPLNNGLKIAVDKKEETKDKHLVREFYRTQHCERTVRFAKHIDTKKVEAKFENGVLSVRIPITDVTNERILIQ